MNYPEIFNLKGKVAIVTGGGRGLGKQMALGLAEAGANVAVCSRKVENCKQAAEEMKKLGVDAIGLRCDVTKPEEIKAMVAEVYNHFGKIDILVNNAGATWGAKAEEMTMEAWNKVQQTNVTGMFVCCQEVGKHMIEQGGGKIINIASIGGVVGGDPDSANTIGYSASKGAVMSLTRELAMEWVKYKIYVNAIAPGLFPTDMSKHIILPSEVETKDMPGLPMRRAARDYELKGAAIFLASKASDYVLGHTLVVDGGSSIS
ncbi:MAG: glucose 1-dehydrogenase [Bacillota bacterium]